ncbi:hypothetical protein STEG23_001918 [Scotinomys teguina]
MKCVWRSEDSLEELILSIHYVGPGDQIQVIRLRECHDRDAKVTDIGNKHKCKHPKWTQVSEVSLWAPETGQRFTYHLLKPACKVASSPENVFRNGELLKESDKSFSEGLSLDTDVEELRERSSEAPPPGGHSGCQKIFDSTWTGQTVTTGMCYYEFGSSVSHQPPTMMFCFTTGPDTIDRFDHGP